MSALLTAGLWYLGRGTGVVALVMLTITLVLGITTRSGRSAAGVSRFGVAELHKTASLTGAGLVLVHVATLLFDPYAQLRLVDLVLPFLGSYRPIWLGLGTLGLDVLVVIVATSLLRHRIGPRAFKAVHWFAYAMWPLAWAHGLMIGTDAGALWFLALAAACGLAAFGAVFWRLSTDFVERGFRRVPRRPNGAPAKVVGR
ncbi:MAG: ferric reductase-like transmembrane domain-containing protein [Nocardioidaceae bacterium]